MNILSIARLSAQRGQKQLYSDVALSLSQGDLIHIEGHNGSGKTTLMRQLCGFSDYNDDAQFYWHGKRCQPQQYSHEVIYCGHQTGLDSRLSVAQNLQLTALLSGCGAVNLEDIAATIGLDKQFYLLAGKLSAGQQKQLSLARLLLSDKPLWLIDEPFSALDDNAIQQWEQNISNYIEQGGAVIYTSHQRATLTATSSIKLANHQ